MIPWSAVFLAPNYKIWFWLLAAFLILYLIKPKPVNQTIPSLMFLLQDKGRAFRTSFLRYLFRDFVFFIQLLILALLIAAACQPFITVKKTALVGNSVIILDASASMQTKDGRWDAALQAAKDSLSRQNSIILVASRPIVIAKETSRNDADDILSDLEPVDTETNLYSAIVASREYVTDADTIVTIISDFRNTDTQQDWRAAVSTLRASGATVRTVGVGGKANNVGIVSVDVQEDKTRIGVTNFNSKVEDVQLLTGSLSQSLTLQPGATDYATVTTPQGVTKVSLQPSDDFDLDNVAYIANNHDLSVNLLIITNSPDIQNTPFYYSLQSITDTTQLDIAIDINNPPALPDIANYDIIVFYDVDPQLLVQRVMRQTSEHVKTGAASIIMYQDNIWDIDFEGILPVWYNRTGTPSSVTSGEFSSITKGINFGDVSTHNIVSGKGHVLAQTEGPVIMLMDIDSGKSLYYGLPKTASFSVEPYYPVFWKRVIETLTGQASTDALNYKTGSVPLLREKLKDSPDFKYNGFLDKQGIYVFDSHTAIANLASQAESLVSADNPESEGLRGDVQETTKDKELTSLAIMAALALLILELFIVKFRGDF